MLLREETRQIQTELADYCRSGVPRPIKGAKADRLHHYRRLVFNVINGTLETAYPVTRQILPEEDWTQMVNDFFINHNPQSPQVWKMPYEFYIFCSENKYSEKFHRPYLTDLLYFEWIEIEVHTMEDLIIPPFQSEGDLLESPLIINPEFRLIRLAYPVHKFSSDELSENAGDYFILCYREQKNLSVRFFEFSSFFAVVFEKLINNRISGKEALAEAGKLFKINDEQVLLQNGLPFFNDLFTQGIILGFAP